jgi:hypothetical protein
MSAHGVHGNVWGSVKYSCIMSIQSLGSIDGLNSEGPERLHIDYAKKGYHASNKNDYIPQMVKWLQCQEAIDLCTVYLQWCAELPPHNETDKDDNEDAAEVNNQVTTKTPDMTINPYPYHVAKAPAFPNTPLHCLEQAHGASEFLPTLKTFIQEKFTSHTLLPNEFDRYNIHKAIHIMLPSKPHVSDCKRQKKIHAIPEHSNGPWKQLSPAHFDTATLHLLLKM